MYKNSKFTTAPFGLFFHWLKALRFIIVPELETALKLSPEEFEKMYGHEKPDQDATVIFSCKLGGRAQKATDLAKSLGYQNAKVYKGSWSEWAEKQGEKAN